MTIRIKMLYAVIILSLCAWHSKTYADTLICDNQSITGTYAGMEVSGIGKFIVPSGIYYFDYYKCKIIFN